MPKRFVASRAAARLAIVAVFAACAAPASPVPTGRQPSVGSPQGDVASLPAAPPAGAAVEACSMLSDTEIEAVTNRAVATKTPGSVMGIFDNGCAWELEEGPEDGIAWTIDLGVVSPGGRNYFDRYMAIAGEPLRGVGDAAVTDEAGGLTAVKGDTMVSVFMIAVMTDEQQMTRELTQAALSHTQ